MSLQTIDCLKFHPIHNGLSALFWLVIYKDNQTQQHVTYDKHSVVSSKIMKFKANDGTCQCSITRNKEFKRHSK